MHPANPTPSPAVQAFRDWNARARALVLPAPTEEEARQYSEEAAAEEDGYLSEFEATGHGQ